MNGLKEKLFELASQDEEFAKKLVSAETPEAAAALLREKGLDVSAEDLLGSEQPEAAGAAKLSDDELDAVAGGTECYCLAGGIGGAGDNDETCGCVAFGLGHYRDLEGREQRRCDCLGCGHGATTDRP